MGAFAGLRLAEVCGLRVVDVDFMRGIVHPAVQYPAQPLKSERGPNLDTDSIIPVRTALGARGELASRDGAHQRMGEATHTVDA